MELITYTAAAKLLGMPRGTLYSLVHQKRLPHVRMGNRLVRFDRLELEAWVQRQKVQVTANAKLDSIAHV